MMFRAFVIFKILLAAVTIAAGSGKANTISYDGIAAVVNSEVITFSEMRQRMVLLAATLGLDVEREGVADRLRPELMQALISERLRLNLAERAGINAGEEELAVAIADVEKRNNMPPGGFDETIISLGGDPQLARRQLRTQIAWQKYVQSNIRPRIVISEGEVEARVSLLKRLAGKKEYLYGEIFIPKNNDAKAASDFIRQLERTIGESPDAERRRSIFRRVARQYSQSASAAGGGEVGWQVGELIGPAKRSALAKTAKGKLSEVLENEDGFYIMLLHDTRVVGGVEEKVTIRRFEIPDDSDSALRAEELENACEIKEGGEIKFRQFVDLEVSGLAEPIRNSVRGREEGEVFVTEGQVYALCKYVRDKITEPNRELVLGAMVAERLDKMVQKTVRSLIRNAYIDVRI